eukprot:scaffold109914_cov63-Phaeocystis_antarctica.AAC.4
MPTFAGLQPSLAERTARLLQLMGWAIPGDFACAPRLLHSPKPDQPSPARAAYHDSSAQRPHMHCLDLPPDPDLRRRRDRAVDAGPAAPPAGGWLRSHGARSQRGDQPVLRLSRCAHAGPARGARCTELCAAPPPRRCVRHFSRRQGPAGPAG